MVSDHRDTLGPRTDITALYVFGAQTWLEVACVAYLCGRLPVEPT